MGKDGRKLSHSWDWLIEHGVSRRVLDAEASKPLQNGSFNENIIIEITNSEESETNKMQVIYNSEYNYGKDIKAVVEKANLTKKLGKEYIDLLTKYHHFIQMSRNHLYDEPTLKIIKNESGETVLEFYCQKKDIEPYLNNIKILKGNIYYNDGKFEKIYTYPIRRKADLKSC